MNDTDVDLNPSWGEWVSGTLDALKHFAKEELTDEVFKQRLDDAAEKIAESTHMSDEAKERQRKHLERIKNDPVRYKKVKGSYENLQGQIAGELGRQQGIENKGLQLKNILKGLGKASAWTSYGMGAFDLMQAIDRHDPVAAGKELVGFFAGLAFSGLVFLAIPGLVAPIIFGSLAGMFAEHYAKELLPNDWAKQIGDFLLDDLHLAQMWEAIESWADEAGDTINTKVNEFYQEALALLPTLDPLVSDLDGDGIETISALRKTLFNHNNDHIKTASGWVSSDDGFLVLDRNHNGTIDDGSELFGDNTPTEAGGTAAHGFAALSEIDTNADGVIDINDKQFSELRVWRDLNQDGVSQTDELFSLEALGIVHQRTEGRKRKAVSVSKRLMTEDCFLKAA